MTPRCRGIYGFTLVELMVSITLGSVIVTMLASSWWMSARFSERFIRSKTTRTDVMDRLRLQRFISAATTVELASPEPDFTITTQNNSQGLILTMWIRPAAFDVPDADTDLFRLKIHTDAKSGLSLHITPSTATDETSESDLVWHLFASRGTCTLAALACDGKWYSEWSAPEHTTLPKAICIQFHSDASGSTAFPDIIIGLPAAGDC